jgi:hypothetical protein
MIDFTLEAYKSYLQAIKASYSNILRFDEFFMAGTIPENFCLIRHDVDRKPDNALQMAGLEHEAGIRATYYFRVKPHVFIPDIIRNIFKLGHEIGYHYESLSDANGDMPLAVKDFEMNLAKFREIAPIHTIAMHGRPFKPFDNRDMWRDRRNHRLLIESYGVLGEVYLDVDYRDIAYITDTGRNWSSTQSNKRDQVNSRIPSDFSSGNALKQYLNTEPHPKLVFQIHPERWEGTPIRYAIQWLKDMAVNLVKKIL